MAQHLISFNVAKDLIDRFKANKRPMLNIGYEHSLSFAETFDAEAVKTLLQQPGCVKFRVYMGMKEDLSICFVLVGVDETDNEILGMAPDYKEGVILELGDPCPPNCPPNQLF